MKHPEVPARLFLSINARKKTFQAVQITGLYGLGVERFLHEVNAILDGADGFGEDSTGGVGMATALKFCGHGEGLAMSAAETGKDGV